MPAIPEDPVKKAATARAELKAREQAMYRAVADEIDQGTLAPAVAPAIAKLLAHARARQQAAAF